MHIVKEIPSLEVATRIAASGFCQPITLGLKEDVANHIGSGDLVYTLFEDKHPIGFAILNVWGQDKEILYLAGIIIDADYQKKELVVKVVAQAIAESPTVFFLALRTQSLRMWIAGSKLCTDWHPGEKDPRDDCDKAGREVSREIGSAFPVGIGVYGGPLYGEKPNHRDPKLQEWWDSICNFERGDAVICVGVLKDRE